MSAWPEERVAELRRLIDSGMTYREIGIRLGTTKNAIIGKAHRLDIYSDRAAPKPYTKADIADLKAAIASGLDLRSIAAAMDRSVESLKHKIEALGLAKPVRSNTRPATSRTAQNEGVRRLKPQIAGRVGAAQAAAFCGDLGNVVTRPAGPPRPQHRVRPVTDDAIRFLDRTTMQCAFLLGDHKAQPAMCCGRDVKWRKDGTPSSWCPEHYALVYRPAEAVSAPEKVAA